MRDIARDSPSLLLLLLLCLIRFPQWRSLEMKKRSDRATDIKPTRAVLPQKAE